MKSTAKLECLVQDLTHAVRQGKTLALLLDYDGTLTPIVSRPEDAQLNTEGLNTLKRLAQSPFVRLALISGRSVEQLQGFVGSILPAPLFLAGLHGGQVWNTETQRWSQRPDENLVSLKNTFLKQVEAGIVDTFQSLPEGVRFEEKGFSFALHYRLAEGSVGQAVHEIFESLYRQTPEIQQAFRLQAGHCVIEIVPQAFNKGAGVRFCLTQWQKANPQLNLVPLFAGDDKTDEIGLKAVLDLGGIGIAVTVPPEQMLGLSEGEQNQLISFEDPHEMQVFLRLLAESLENLAEGLKCDDDAKSK
jgi:trehalose 6-phosphate phosphatase